jgi:hypothetical protein
MALTPLTGTATTTVKVSDYNALVAALNTELDILRERLASYEAQLGGRLTVLENEPDPIIPPDLTTRVEALENLIVRSPVENPGPALAPAEPPPPPPNLDTSRPQLVYNQATIYYSDVELHAQRIGETRWLLRSRLNYIVISPAEWAYEEIFEGTADEVYEHAVGRLMELAELKPQHDLVHERVRLMSEGR